MEAIYPEGTPNYYGTVQPMCLCNLMTPFVIKRTKELQQWLDGIEEGNVCGGSIKMIPSSAH